MRKKERKKVWSHKVCMDRKLENWNSFYSISNLAIIKQFDFGVMVARAFSIPIFESHAWFDLNLIKSISLLFLPFFLSSILRRQLSFHLVWGSTFTRPGPILWFFSILVPRLRTQISQVFVLSIRGKSIIENQMQIQIRRWQMMTIIYVHHVHHSSNLYEKKLLVYDCDRCLVSICNVWYIGIHIDIIIDQISFYYCSYSIDRTIRSLFEYFYSMSDES